MATLDIDDTIVAIASPPGPAFRGIVRISGPGTIACISRSFRPNDGGPICAYRSATWIDGQLKLDSDTELPGVLLLWPTQQSYTRQPTAEFHTFGCAPLLQLALSEFCESGARLARPGEFTLRAFLSGRIDLTQAEAVLAVIDSTGDQQLSTALQQLAGGLAGPLGAIRSSLLDTLAELEAGLDFVEEDIEFISHEELARQLEDVVQQLESIMKQISKRELTADSVKVVLDGVPNSGKSSLFNALTESNQAIVTDVAGTTTDFLTARLNINSALIELIDTAGFENSAEQLTQQAQHHRVAQQDQAGVKLFCIDVTQSPSRWEQEQLAKAGPLTIVVLTKSDLWREPGAAQMTANQLRSLNFEGPVVVTSVVDSSGLDRLREEIAISILDSEILDHSVVSSTVVRAAESLREARHSVQHALVATRQRLGEEIVSAEIRQALEALGQVVGTVYTDDILDLVFGRFCIGK